MILKTYRVSNFKSITDSGEIRVDENVTALVGKNESGKTACLEALYRLNPVPTGHPDSFVPLRDFPRPRLAAQEDVEDEQAIEATFGLGDADLKEIAEVVGDGVMLTTDLKVTKNFRNRRVFYFSSDESKTVPHLMRRHQIDPELAAGAGTMKAAVLKLEQMGASPNKPSRPFANSTCACRSRRFSKPVYRNFSISTNTASCRGASPFLIYSARRRVISARGRPPLCPCCAWRKSTAASSRVTSMRRGEHR
jgi:hypothetical protein